MQYLEEETKMIEEFFTLFPFLNGTMFSYWTSWSLYLLFLSGGVFILLDCNILTLTRHTVYQEVSQSVITVVGSMFLLTLFPNITQYFDITYFAGYLLVGIFWSILRFMRRCDFIVKDMLDCCDMTTKSRYCPYTIPDMKASNNKHRIINWILFFPISVIRWALNDIIDLMCTIFDKFLVNIYNIFAKKYLNQAKELKATSDAIKKAKAKAGQEARMGKNRVTHARQPDTM